MNRIFRLVRNRSTGVWQAVSETASSHAGGARSLLAITLTAAGSLATAQDLPSGGQVVSGSASMVQSGKTLTITQDSARLATDWQSFNIGDGHAVRFVQPSAASAALNRVVGNDVSKIQGALQANGQVFLINPNGVLFTPSARVDVGALVASTLNLATDDFLAGRLRFEGNSAAAVVNQGKLQAAPGGGVALLAARIHNSGEITAPGGQVALGAGRKVRLDLGGPVQLEVEEAAIDALIEQGGAIRADGGTVLLHARAATDLAAVVINNGGVIEARHLVPGQNGSISLSGDGGVVEIAGQLDASSPTGRGGSIVATGSRVLVQDGALLNASGASGGGTVHVGGGWQGKNAGIANAADTIVRAGAELRADARQSGDGGEVVVWSDGGTHFAGRISATGGVEGGNGGRVEVSGKGQLGFTGRVDTAAPQGRAGLLLLDPSNLNIVNGSDGQSGMPADWANPSGGAAYTIPETVLEAMTGDVVLTATTDIILHDLADNLLNLSATNIYFYANDESSGSTLGGFTMRDANDVIRLNQGAGSRIVFQGGAVSSRNLEGDSPSPFAFASIFVGNVETLGANVEFNTKRSNAALPVIVQGNITTNGGNINVAPGTRFGLVNSGVVDVTLNGAVSTGGGSFTSNMVGTVRINGGLDLGSGMATFGGTGTQLNSLLSSTGNLRIASPLSFGAGAGISTPGSITFDSDASMLAGGSLTLTASDFVFNNTFSGNGASITLRPNNPGANIDVGMAGAGDMQISSAALAQLSNFSSLTIGRSDATGMTQMLGDVTMSASNRIELINRRIDVVVGSLTNDSGAVVLTGDLVNLGNRLVTGNGASATIRPLDPATGLQLNALPGAAITTDVLELGSNGGSDVTLTSDITTTAHTVHLRSAGNINASAGGISAANVAVSAGGSVTLTDDSFDFTQLAVSAAGDVHAKSSNVFQVGTVQGVVGANVGAHRLTLETGGSGTVTASQSIRAGELQLLGPLANFDLLGAVHSVGQLDASVGGDLSFTNAGALTLGNVDAGGGIDIATQQGDLTLAGVVVSSSSSAQAVVLNAGRDRSALDATGGDIQVIPGSTVSTGNGGRATLYSGSLAGNASLAALVGDGRSRYASDEAQSGYDAVFAALTSGLYAIYREQPMLDVAPTQNSGLYGSVLPSFGFGLTGLANGDTDAYVVGDAAFALPSAVLSAAGHEVAGTHDAAYSGGLTSALGYGFRDDIASTGELTVLRRPVALADAVVQGKAYDGSDAASVTPNGLTGVLTGDNASVVMGAARFADAQAGNAKNVSFSATLSGDDAGNYLLQTPDLTGTIAPRPITVTAENGGKVYGEADPALGWGITQGNLIGADTLAGGVTRVAGENVGSYATRAALANSNYDISVVDGTLTIAPRLITITANSATKVYGENDPKLGWRVTGGNLVAGDKLNIGIGRAAGENVGSYEVHAVTLPDGNYDIRVVNGTMAITPRAITIKADSASKRAGASDPSLGWQLSQGRLVGTDQLQVAVRREAGEEVGSYAVMASAQPDANYEVSVVDGVMSIVRAAPAGVDAAVANAQAQAAAQTVALTGAHGPSPLTILNTTTTGAFAAGGALELVPVDGSAALPAMGGAKGPSPLQVFVVDSGLRLPDASVHATSIDQDPKAAQ